MAAEEKILFYELGAIGQHGIVSGSPRGKNYFNQFHKSHLGKIFATGKYAFNTVDDSDSATYYVLLGRWGVSLCDVASDGTNNPEVEKANEKKFFQEAAAIRAELLTRSDVAAGKGSE